ncbi:cell shape-determining L,D-carboxypeptidase Csd6 [Arcobacter sp. 15-2]|uniref:L,D-transpeptidase family protein n=1 Tax=Arcobacter sp. 15-2 TaxID=3374109 RepID=UPI00399CAD9D
MKYVILSLFLFNSLWANSLDIIELYRTQGISAVEQEIAKQLKTKRYWDYNLANKDVTNGYYESIQYVMICQKDMKDIKLYDTKNKKQLFDSSVFIGKANGDKKVEGDLKTPLGAYNITKRITKIDQFYGPLALTTNYPNLYDKSQGKTGHGIWIHGLPFKEERDDYTEGCIALDNDKITTLDKKINIKNSVLVISENKLEEVSKNDLSIVLSSVFKWRDAWKYNDLNTYLSFYDQDFQKANGQRIEEFKKFKKKIFNRQEHKSIRFYNINVIPYPNDLNKKLFKVIMDEEYKTKRYKFVGKKLLYLEVKNNHISILAES